LPANNRIFVCLIFFQSFVIREYKANAPLAPRMDYLLLVGRLYYWA